MFDKIVDGFVKTFIAEDRYKMFLNGFWNTIQIAFVATLIGVAIGAIVAIIRVFHKQTGKLGILDKICEIYTTVIRGTPVVVQLLITYNIIFAWSTRAVLVGMIGFGLNSGAYVAEIMRGGINAVDIGQTEAGRSLGLNWFQTMRYVVMPQAFKRVIPPLGNEFIAMLKDSSLVSVIGFEELTRRGQLIIAKTYSSFEIWMAVAVLYLIMTLTISRLVAYLERRYNIDDRH